MHFEKCGVFRLEDFEACKKAIFWQFQGSFKLPKKKEILNVKKINNKKFEKGSATEFYNAQYIKVSEISECAGRVPNVNTCPKTWMP